MAQAKHPGADLQLNLLVGLMAVAALSTLVVAIDRAGATVSHIGITRILLVVVAIGLASRAVLPLRIKSTVTGVSSLSAAILFGLALIPPSYVILATAIAVGLVKSFGRLEFRKTVFNTSKDILSAAFAGWAATAAGLTAPAATWREVVLPIMIAAVTYAIADSLLAFPVLALASNASMRDVLLKNWDLDLTAVIVKLAGALIAIAVYLFDPLLLIALPPLAYMLQRMYATQLRERAERKAWRELAATTDDFNRMDLETVLRTAVCRAVDLFSADAVEIELRLDGVRQVVRSGEGTGAPAGRPTTDQTAVGLRYLRAIDRELTAGGTDFGLLRLLFRGNVQLSEREGHTLGTFAASLSTAIRNAHTFAESQKLAETNAYAAAHDLLTGMGNRRKLMEHGAALLADPPVRGVSALLLVDLDHFKDVNDALGHTMGDEVIVAVGHRLADAADPHDLVVRLGGDEFAVLMFGLSAPAVALPRAYAMMASLDDPFEVAGVRISVEASGGVATIGQRVSMVELLRRADVAMYQAKREGRRVVAYSRGRDTADLDRLALGADLPRAVAEHQFTVEFQPIVDLGSGEVIAAEVLARWNHPDRGELDPRGFLEAVERSAMLPAFAQEILDQGLTAANAWADAGFEIPIAVNVSPRSLLDVAFPEVVYARLQAHQVPASRLVLEVTESFALSQLPVVDEVLAILRDFGVRVALDDFGTGFSSLATLARVPVHEIKIDRSFVTDMDTPAAAAVVRSTIELGRSLDLLIVAEGVERDDQRHTLWELGCPAGQGHLFARPMGAARLLAMLRTGVGGRPGTLAAPLHDTGTVIRMPASRRGGFIHRRRAT